MGEALSEVSAELISPLASVPSIRAVRESPMVEFGWSHGGTHKVDFIFQVGRRATAAHTQRFVRCRSWVVHRIPIDLGSTFHQNAPTQIYKRFQNGA
jgi:hypothetical protein